MRELERFAVALRTTASEVKTSTRVFRDLNRTLKYVLETRRVARRWKLEVLFVSILVIIYLVIGFFYWRPAGGSW